MRQAIIYIPSSKSQAMSSTSKHTANASTHRTLQKLRKDLVYSARYHPTPARKGSRDSKTPIYESAKQAEINQRNLLKAASLYAQAALNGEKIDSCLKDFASIIHQMGQTSMAVSFLKEVRQFYDGDLLRFDRLITTLEKQKKPSGKHHTKFLLVQMKVKVAADEIPKIFGNASRVKNIKCFNCLDFNPDNEQKEGRWLLYEFQSFSGAKKTLEKFNQEQFFGVNLFWVREGEILCRATDGREDFEAFRVEDEDVKEAYFRGELWASEWKEGSEMQVRNRVAIRLIEMQKKVKDRSDLGQSRNLVWDD